MKLAVVVGLLLALPSLADAAPSERQKKKAKQHAKNATQLFEAKSYELALVEFKKAYELFPVPGLLFNMGQCNLFLGDHQKAIEQFESFLTLKPDTPYRADVERLIGEAKGELAKQRAEEEAEREKEIARETPPVSPPVIEPPPPPIAEPPPPPVEEEGSPVYAEWWFWTIIGGVAVAAGGTAIALVATRDETTVLPMGDLGVLDRR
jgi:tetratricopeptide (TPR) repeat protein